MVVVAVGGGIMPGNEAEQTEQPLYHQRGRKGSVGSSEPCWANYNGTCFYLGTQARVLLHSLLTKKRERACLKLTYVCILYSSGAAKNKKRQSCARGTRFTALYGIPLCAMIPRSPVSISSGGGAVCDFLDILFKKH